MERLRGLAERGALEPSADGLRVGSPATLGVAIARARHGAGRTTACAHMIVPSGRAVMDGEPCRT